MKATHLRIGNTVEYKGNPHQIDESDFDSLEREIDEGVLKPILLTEEWLLRFGFKVETIKGGRGEFKFYTKDCLVFNTSHQRWWLNKGHSPTNPKHVHQLQNLYYALTGTELTIKE